MSEPMSSGDIEDVLSSIRRLVSEDLRPVTKATEGGRQVAAEPAGKLLLTPALRVVGPDAFDAEPVAQHVAPKASNRAETAKAPDLDAAEDAFAEGAAADPAELSPAWLAQAEAVPETAAIEMSPPASAVADEDWLPESPEDDMQPGWAQAKPATPDPNDAKAAAAAKLTRVVSEIGAGVSEAEDDWEAETGDAPVSSLSWLAPEWVEEAELADETGYDAELSEAFDKSVADLAEDAAVAEIMAQAAKGKTQAKAESAQAKSAQAKTAAEKKSTDAASDDIFAEDEAVFDETVLRDLVRDLIREELSGTLGERITRNVRKLVRAEINRALTARDFD